MTPFCIYVRSAVESLRLDWDSEPHHDQLGCFGKLIDYP